MLVNEYGIRKIKFEFTLSLSLSLSLSQRRPDIVDHIFNSSRVLSFTLYLELTDIPSLSLPKKSVYT